MNATNVSVAEMNSQTTSSLETIIKVKVIVDDLAMLEKLIVSVKNISEVYSVERDFR